MKKELDDALVKDFPNLYADRRGDMRSTCMCWGFDCGDGWEPLIRRCSEKLEKLILALPDPDTNMCKASQIKEKFGSLRFYMTGETDLMSEAIREAEKESMVTCEECGSPGSLKGFGWVKTLCDSCNKEDEE